MAFNGSGTFNRLYSWVVQAGLGQKIRSDQMDQDSNDIATGLSNCITKDGQQTITANIPFNSHKITGLGNGTALQDAATITQVQSGSSQSATTVGGTADVITLTMTPVTTAYATGEIISWIASGANTTNVTVNKDGLGAKALTKNGTTALVAGDIPSGALISARYDGTRYQLTTPATVSTNANLTGDVTSVGNATTIGAGKVTEAMQVLTDNTTQDFSTSKHGYVPKGTNVGKTLYDDGTWKFSYLPQNSKSAAYTTVLADGGGHIYHPGADTTARIWTIDSNANVAYPIGTAITFVNDTSAGVITISIASDTLVLAGAGSTGSRTLAANGIATAVKMTSTRWMISGTGLT